MENPIILLPTTNGYIPVMCFDNYPSQTEQIAALTAKVNELTTAINKINGV